MAQRTLGLRVERLEHLVKSLEDLPSQVAGLGERMDRFEVRLDAVEGRLDAVEGRLGTVELQIVQLRTDMNDGFSAIREEMATLDARFSRRIDETQTLMRVLHEDVIARIAALGG